MARPFAFVDSLIYSAPESLYLERLGVPFREGQGPNFVCLGMLLPRKFVPGEFLFAGTKRF